MPLFDLSGRNKTSAQKLLTTSTQLLNRPTYRDHQTYHRSIEMELFLPESHAVTACACLDGNRNQSTTATSKRAGTSPNR
jgi:hypothetical protein